MRKLIAALLSGGAACCAMGSIAFTQDAFSIHVESHQVLVPTEVFDINRTTAVNTPTESRCYITNAETFFKLRPDEPYMPPDCSEDEIRDLAAKDFHVFEDRLEQNVHSVTLERWPEIDVRDNLAHHEERSFTPSAKWSFSDMGQRLGLLPITAGYFYRIAYVPPQTRRGEMPPDQG